MRRLQRAADLIRGRITGESHRLAAVGGRDNRRAHIPRTAAAHNRSAGITAAGVQLHFSLQRGERGRVAEILAVGVGALGAIECVWLAHTRRPGRCRTQGGEGIAHHLFDRDLRISELMHEGAVGTVLEQPPHEIRQELLVSAHRRVDPHGREIRDLGARGVVERLAHALQSLELVRGARGRELQHRGDRVGVVRRELRMEHVACGEQLPGALEIARIRRGLGGIHRERSEAALLGALDLAVPVGALDEPHHEPTARPAREIGKPVYQRERALLVGLHREPEPVPVRQGSIERQPLDEHPEDHTGAHLIDIVLVRKR